MKEEIDVLERNGTLNLEDLPPEKKGPLVVIGYIRLHISMMGSLST